MKEQIQLEVRQLLTDSAVEERFFDVLLSCLSANGIVAEEIGSQSISFATARAVQYVLNFCHVCKLPERLYFVTCRAIASDLLLKSLHSGDTGAIQESQVVKQLTEGDVTVVFADSAKTPEERKREYIQQLADRLCFHTDELIVERRMAW